MYCRLCAGVKFDKINQSSSSSDVDDKELNEKVKLCVNIDLTEADLLPKNVCDDCKSKVDLCYDFLLKVIKAQKLLKEILLIPKAEPFFDDYISSPWDVKKENGTSAQVKQEPNGNGSTNDGKTLLRKRGRKKKGEQVENLLRKSKTNVKSLKKSKETEEHTEITVDKDVSAYVDDNVQRVCSDEKPYFKSYTWYCVECDHKFNKCKLLQEHFLSAHQHKILKYKCNLCSKSYENLVSFKKHLKNHRDKDKYVCKQCGKRFYASSHLRCHQETKHTLEKNFECDVCGSHMKTKSSLTAHRNRHFRTSEKTFTCDSCPKTFFSLGNLKTHQTIHNGVKQHTCELCGRSFLFKGNLAGHMAGVHNDSAAFKCHICTRSFKTWRSFKRHAKIHTGIKEHKCETCGRCFHRRAALIVHNRIHTGEAPFECEHCKKRFKLKQLLKVHLRTHTGERPYSCTECNQDFIDWSNYNQHMRSRHHKDIRSLATKLIRKQQQSMMKSSVDEILIP